MNIIASSAIPPKPPMSFQASPIVLREPWPTPGGKASFNPPVGSKPSKKPPSGSDWVLRGCLFISLPRFSDNFARTISSILSCCSGGRPINKSPKFSIPITSRAPFMIIGSASSRVRPPSKQSRVSNTRSNKPQSLRSPKTSIHTPFLPPPPGGAGKAPLMSELMTVARPPAAIDNGDSTVTHALITTSSSALSFLYFWLRAKILATSFEKAAACGSS